MVGHAESSKRRWISDHYVDLMVHQRIFLVSMALKAYRIRRGGSGVLPI